ncbi:hypothetical protein J7T55_012525 [Diaporthe amygdali]|uniref:uncharacterized protein n=1 Tax=Phomopsis amygdali TaxID=1214568 RepID=UPI0022FE8769|nr:uncharacterized protein J7T55_012525 [Diaporthe amygdali]KAJ0124052.1 hypothetical protein J7T55_012525 [Diaporthe amygdali]
MEIDSSSDRHDAHADSQEHAQQARKPLKRRRGACEGCRPKKVRCDGGRPCSACKKSGDECRYVSTMKRWKHARSWSRSSENSNEETIVWGPARPGSPSVVPETAHHKDGEPLPTAISLITPSSSIPIQVSDGVSTHSPSQGSLTPRAPAIPNSSTYHGQQTPSLFPQDINNQDWNSMFTEDSFDLSQFAVTTPVQTVVPLDEPDQIRPTTATDETTITLNSPVHLLPNHLDFDHLGLIQFDRGTGRLELIPSDHGPDSEMTACSAANPCAFLMDFGDCPLDRRTQSEIVDIMKTLAPRQTIYQQPGTPDILEVRAMLPDSDAIGEYITACCEDPIGVGTFLTKQSVNDVIQQARHAKGRSGEQKVAACLINAVLALGAHILSARTPRDSFSSHNSNGQAYFSTASSLRDGLVYVEDSLLKFQVSFSQRMNYQLTAGLLAQATQCAQSLRLNSERATKTQLNPTPELESRAKRAFWYLYSMEKTFCLTQGTFSIIDDGNIQYPPPSPTKRHRGPHDFDWLHVLVLYARVSSAIAKELYHTKSPLRSVEHFDRTISNLRGQLEAWKGALPHAYRKFIDSDGHQGALGEPTEHSLQLYMLYQYHQALFAMYGPISRLPVDCTGLEMFQQCIYRCEHTCLASARVVLLVGSHLSLAAALIDRHLLHLPLIAVCTIFRAVMRSAEAERKDLSYLGLACGILGKLSLEFDVPLEQVLELSRHARSVVSEKADKPERPGAVRQMSRNEFH